MDLNQELDAIIARMPGASGDSDSEDAMLSSEQQARRRQDEEEESSVEEKLVAVLRDACKLLRKAEDTGSEELARELPWVLIACTTRLSVA